jgi:hypothetical protein
VVVVVEGCSSAAVMCWSHMHLTLRLC